MKKDVKMPKNAMVLLVVLGGIVVLAAGWMLLLAPKQKEIGSIKQQTAAVRQQITDDLARAATARNATGAPTIKVADIYKLTTAMPSFADMPDLLLELDQTAKAAGVTLQSIQPGAATDTSTGYSTIPITVAAAGNFYTITDLLYRLRNLVYVRNGALEANGRLFSVSTVSLTPNGRAITAQISLTTYVYGSAATSSATSTLPSTDTTATTTSTTTTTAAPSGPTAAGATP